MKLGIYCIFNELDNAFGQVFEATTDTKASYLFAKAQVPDKQYCHVYKTGDIDTSTGVSTSLNAPYRLSEFEIKQTTIGNIENSMIVEKELKN